MSRTVKAFLRQLGSCNCMTKTPDAEMHAESCAYKHLANAQETFERWFLRIPDVDETLLDKNKAGDYIDDSMNLALVSYCQGIKQALNGRAAA